MGTDEVKEGKSKGSDHIRLDSGCKSNYTPVIRHRKGVSPYKDT